jgi:hypothetical protein
MNTWRSSSHRHNTESQNRVAERSGGVIKDKSTDNEGAYLLEAAFGRKSIWNQSRRSLPSQRTPRFSLSYLTLRDGVMNWWIGDRSQKSTIDLSSLQSRSIAWISLNIMAQHTSPVSLWEIQASKSKVIDRDNIDITAQELIHSPTKSFLTSALLHSNTPIPYSEQAEFKSLMRRTISSQ